MAGFNVDSIKSLASVAGSGASLSQSLGSRAPQVIQGAGMGGPLPQQQAAPTNYPTAPLKTGGSPSLASPMPLAKPASLMEILQVLSGR